MISKTIASFTSETSYFCWVEQEKEEDDGPVWMLLEAIGMYYILIDEARARQ